MISRGTRRKRFLRHRPVLRGMKVPDGTLLPFQGVSYPSLRGFTAPRLAVQAREEGEEQLLARSLKIQEWGGKVLRKYPGL